MLKSIEDWLFTPEWPSMMTNGEKLLILSVCLITFCLLVAWLLSLGKEKKKIYRFIESYVRGFMGPEPPQGNDSEEEFWSEWEALEGNQDELQPTNEKQFFIRVTIFYGTRRSLVAFVAKSELEAARELCAVYEKFKMRRRGFITRHLTIELLRNDSSGLVPRSLFVARERD